MAVSLAKRRWQFWFVSVGERCVRFAAEWECYHRIYIKAVVSGSCVRVGKKVRLSVLSMFSKMRILCGRFLSGRERLFCAKIIEISYICKVGIVV